MNERKFLRELNSKANRERDLTPAIVNELLRDEKMLALRKKPTIWSKFLKKKSATQIIRDNFQNILDKTDYFKLNILLEQLAANPQTLDIIKENFGVIINRYSMVTKETGFDMEEMLGFVKVQFWRICKERLSCANELIITNMDMILQGGVTIAELPYLKGLSEETDEKLNETLECTKTRIAKNMLINNGDIAFYNHKLLDDYSQTIVIMLEELLKSEKVKMIDIKQIGRGTYSQVYQIGEKVLKIGKPRATYQIPNHQRILQPLARTNFIDEQDDNRVFCCAEVSDRVDELSNEEIQKEKLYEVYKELREDGIIWTDAKFSNVGKLRKTNIPNLDGETMHVSPQAVGMEESVKGVTLDVGDWVIIDTDYIYKQEDNSIMWDTGSYSKAFEKRWQRERQEKLAKKVRDDTKVVTREEERQL